MPTKRGRHRKPLSLRILPALLDRVRARAEAEDKSLNETMNQLMEYGLDSAETRVSLGEIKRELGAIQQALLKLALR